MEPRSAPLVYRTLIVAGAVALVVSAVLLGVMAFNWVTRPELYDPVPLEDAGHAQPLPSIARL